MKTSFASWYKAVEEIKKSGTFFKYNSEKEEPYIQINSNTREIIIPDSMQNIGVVGDHNAETVWFKIDRFFDRVDFADIKDGVDDRTEIDVAVNYQIMIQFVNALNEPYNYFIDKAYVVTADMIEDNYPGEPDTVIFPWELTNEVTKQNGIIRFAVRIYKTEIEKDIEKVVYAFNTQQAQFNILNSLNNIDAPGTVETLTPTQIEEIFNKISAIYTESLGIVKDTNGEKVNSIITYDYSVLGKKPAIIAGNKERIELVGDIDIGTLLTGATDDQLITLKTLDTEIDAESENAVTNKAIAEKFETVEPLASISATSTNPVQSKTISVALKEIDEKFKNIKIDVDAELSDTSTNPVQNQRIFKELAKIREEMGGLSYVPIDIISFATDPYYEKGRTITAPIQIQFNWELTKVPNTLTIEGLNADANTITPSQNGQLMTSAYPAMSEDTTFTLVATDAKGEDRMDFTVKFVLPLYYGKLVLDSTSTLDASILNKDILTKVLSETKEITFTVAPGVSEYIIFASPVDYGECSFKVGGFDGGFVKAATVSKTNDYNVSAEYYIYKSSNANLGTTTVQVI